MINNLLRGFIYFVVFVLIQVLVLNNIHFLRIATPFLYLYFIIKMPVGSSRTQVVFFSFIAICADADMHVKNTSTSINRKGIF